MELTNNVWSWQNILLFLAIFTFILIVAANIIFDTIHNNKRKKRQLKLGLKLKK